MHVFLPSGTADGCLDALELLNKDHRSHCPNREYDRKDRSGEGPQYRARWASGLLEVGKEDEDFSLCISFYSYFPTDYAGAFGPLHCMLHIVVEN